MFSYLYFEYLRFKVGIGLITSSFLDVFFCFAFKSTFFSLDWFLFSFLFNYLEGENILKTSSHSFFSYWICSFYSLSEISVSKSSNYFLILFLFLFLLIMFLSLINIDSWISGIVPLISPFNYSLYFLRKLSKGSSYAEISLVFDGEI